MTEKALAVQAFGAAGSVLKCGSYLRTIPLRVDIKESQSTEGARMVMKQQINRGST